MCPPPLADHLIQENIGCRFMTDVELPEVCCALRGGALRCDVLDVRWLWCSAWLRRQRAEVASAALVCARSASRSRPAHAAANQCCC